MNLTNHPFVLDPVREQVIEMYHSRVSVLSIAEQLKVSPQTVNKALRRWRVPYVGVAPVYRPKKPATHCKFGHKLEPGTYYLRQRPGRTYPERECKVCKHRANTAYQTRRAQRQQKDKYQAMLQRVLGRIAAKSANEQRQLQSN